MDTYYTADQLEALAARDQWEHEMQRPERQEYTDRAEFELALLSGFDPFAGEDLDTFFARTIDEAIDAEIPSLAQLGL